jgi:hypothetical protein
MKKYELCLCTSGAREWPGARRKVLFFSLALHTAAGVRGCPPLLPEHSTRQNKERLACRPLTRCLSIISALQLLICVR